jgi:uncharacterized protein
MRFIFELGDIQEGGLNFSWMGSGEKLTREGDSLFFRESLRLRLHLEKNKEQVLVEGELSTVLDLTCSRCLINYPFAVKEEIFALFISQEKALSLSEEKELGAEEFNINYYSGDSLELTEVLRDQLLLCIPMTHRCKEECLGLCPSCGQNWNQGSCDCPRGDKTSPFETLKKLKL